MRVHPDVLYPQNSWRTFLACDEVSFTLLTDLLHVQRTAVSQGVDYSREPRTQPPGEGYVLWRICDRRQRAEGVDVKGGREMERKKLLQ